MNIYEALDLWAETCDEEVYAKPSEEGVIAAGIVECHCFNHFMEALEELKEFEELIQSSLQDGDLIHVTVSKGDLYQLNKLITKIETVEGI